jgi:hypothetical protein
MSGFRGFPPELFTFLEGPEKDNSKAYWAANKTGWEEKVHDSMRHCSPSSVVSSPR